MVLQEVKLIVRLGQSAPILRIHALDAQRKPYKDTFTVWITYENTAPSKEGISFGPEQDIVIPLQTNLGRAIVSVVPHSLKNAYIIPERLVVDPSEGSKAVDFIILKQRGEIEPSETTPFAKTSQTLTGLFLGAIAGGAAYGIYHYFVRTPR